MWLLAAFTGALSRVFQPASLIFLAAGAFAPALARLTYYESINIIGVARASTLSNTTPIFAAILAVPFLHEELTWRLVLGTVMVVFGVALAMGFLFYFLALNLGDIVRVTPLSNTSPIFAVALLYAFRQIENVAPSTTLGAVLTVAGIVFVVSG